MLPSSGIQRRLVPMWIGTTCTFVSCLIDFLTLKMEALISFEISVHVRTASLYIRLPVIHFVLSLIICFLVSLNRTYYSMFLLCAIHQIYCEIADSCNEILTAEQPRQSARYSDWLSAGGPRGRSSTPSKRKTSLFSTSFRSVLGPLSLLRRSSSVW
jgi:hypothetical protein